MHRVLQIIFLVLIWYNYGADAQSVFDLPLYFARCCCYHNPMTVAFCIAWRNMIPNMKMYPTLMAELKVYFLGEGGQRRRRPPDMRCAHFNFIWLRLIKIWVMLEPLVTYDTACRFFTDVASGTWTPELPIGCDALCLFLFIFFSFSIALLKAGVILNPTDMITELFWFRLFFVWYIKCLNMYSMWRVKFISVK